MANPIKILLVDDEEELLELYEMKLESKSHNVQTAIDGNTAIGLLQKEKYQLILCDINMPNGNGIDVFNHFKSSGCAGKFVFITGHAKGSPELKSAEATGATVFNKPVNWDDIWNLIETLDSPLASVRSATPAVANAEPAKSPEQAKKNVPPKAATPKQEAVDVKIPSSLEKKGLDLIRSINRSKK